MVAQFDVAKLIELHKQGFQCFECHNKQPCIKWWNELEELRDEMN